MGYSDPLLGRMSNIKSTKLMKILFITNFIISSVSGHEDGTIHDEPNKDSNLGKIATFALAIVLIFLIFYKPAKQMKTSFLTDKSDSGT